MIPKTHPNDDPQDVTGADAAQDGDEPFRIELDPDAETLADTMYREHLETHWGF